MNEGLKTFLEMNLPKVKPGKKAKFQLGVVRAAHHRAPAKPNTLGL